MNTCKKSLNESQGVVENNMVDFAEYLWHRCINNKRKPNRYGEITFVIPSAQWNKYNTYNLSNDSIRVYITDRKSDAEASFSKIVNRTPEIEINDTLIRSGHNRFISVIMHELTHAINGMANLKDNESIWNRNKPKLSRIGASPNSKSGQIGYLFSPTEMNARITEAYYYLLNNEVSWYDDIVYEGNKIVYRWFDEIDKITRYKDMVKYTKLVYDDASTYNYGIGYGQYIKDLNSPSIYDSGITSTLRLGKNKPNKDHTFSQYLKRKLDIVFYMQSQCENFKKRIYKMLYKVINDIKSNHH